MDLKLGLEYRDVALRPEHVEASEMSQPEIVGLIEVLESASEIVEIFTKIRPLSPDQNDDMILDLAINGRADAVITNNTKHFFAAGKRFGVAVLSPSEFLILQRKGDQYGN